MCWVSRKVYEDRVKRRKKDRRRRRKKKINEKENEGQGRREAAVCSHRAIPFVMTLVAKKQTPTKGQKKI